MVEVNTTIKRKVDIKSIKGITELFLKEYNKSGYDVSVAVVGESRMRRLNLIYRGIAQPTDVLSFVDGGQTLLPRERRSLGEVVLCLEVIKRQAKRFGNTPKKELAFILVHGLLHLTGRDDKTEKERLKMIKMGNRFLTKINFE